MARRTGYLLAFLALLLTVLFFALPPPENGSERPAPPPEREEPVAPPPPGLPSPPEAAEPAAEAPAEPKPEAAPEIRGRVLEPDRRKPVSCEVEVRRDSPTPEGKYVHEKTKTDETGRFRFAGLPPGRYEVEVELPDKAVGVEAPRGLVVEAGGPPLEIVLEPRCSLTVHVDFDEDPAGPVAALQACAVGPGGENYGSQAHTNVVNGSRFRFEPRRGERITLRAAAPGYEPIEEEFLVGANDRKRSHRLVLVKDRSPRGAAHITLVDDRGERVPGMRVYLRVSPNLGAPVGKSSKTGEIEGELPAGRRVLEASNRSYRGFEQPWIETRFEVDVAAPARSEFVLTVRTGGWFRITGVDRDAGNMTIRPTDSGEAWSCSLYRAPDGNGSVLNRCNPFPPGRYVLRWEPEGGAAVTREAEILPARVTEVTFD